MRPLVKYIDTAALLHNWHTLTTKANGIPLIAVVKANAYGHDIATIATTLAPYAPYFAVACIEEALTLRALNIHAPIMLLEGIFSADELPECTQHNLQPVIHTPQQLNWLNHHPHSLKAWLKIDSGMHRLGFPAQQTSIDTATAISHIRWQGIVSHFACADESDLNHAHNQLHRIRQLTLPRHWRQCLANSAAIFALPEAHGDLVRPGLALYGLSPFANKTAQELGLQPVMTLRSAILATRTLQQGDSAGYGQGFIAPHDGTLATIALGYGDGFNRSIPSGKVQVHIHGKRYPLVGRIAMDMSLVWLGTDTARIGENVTIFGTDNPAETLATEANTIPYTLTTMLTPRVHLHIMETAAPA